MKDKVPNETVGIVSNAILHSLMWLLRELANAVSLVRYYTHVHRFDTSVHV